MAMEHRLMAQDMAMEPQDMDMAMAKDSDTFSLNDN